MFMDLLAQIDGVILAGMGSLCAAFAFSILRLARVFARGRR